MNSVKRFCRDESGQSIVFAAFTLFALVIMSIMLFGVGETTATQMRLQNSADAAAYAGAQIEADCVAQIAWMNEGMSQIYYNMVRHCVDNADHALLAELKEAAPDWDPTGFGLPATTPSDAVVGIANASTEWQNSYDKAKVWVPRAEAWLRRLSQLQRGIAVMAPTLVEHQIYFSAEANGAARTCYYPGFEFLPEGPTRHECEIEKIGEYESDPWQPNGWHIASTTDNFDVNAMHNFFAADDTEEYVDADASKYKGFLGWDGNGWHDVWNIDINEEKGNTKIEVKARHNSETWGENFPADYIFTVVDPDGKVDKKLVSVKDTEGKAVEVLTLEGDGGDIKLDFTKDYVEIDQGGNKAALKHNDKGELCKWVDDDGDGEKDDDEWEVIHDQTTVDVNGVEVPLDFDPDIHVGGMTVTLKAPVHIHFNRLHIVLRNPLTINYSTGIGAPGLLNVQDKRATLNGLSTLTPDPRWSHPSHGWARKSQDRIYHRLYGEGEDFWMYEWIRVGSYLGDMPMDQFSAHTIMEFDPYYNANVPAERRWEMPDADDKTDWNDNASTGDNMWKYYPVWAQPERRPPDDDFTDREFGGWFDAARCAPQTDIAYTQSRICWYCGMQGSGAAMMPLRDLNDSSSTHLKMCVRPCGFWHEVYPNNGVAQDRLTALEDAGAVVVGVIGPLNPSNPYENRYVLQVYCPMNCKAEFRDGSYPRNYGDPANLHLVPTRVRRIMKHAYGRFDMAGRDPDYLKRVRDFGYNPETAPERRDFFSVRPDFFNNYYFPPLQVDRETGEMFRNSITVMTWAPTMEDRAWQGVGGKDATENEARVGIRNPLEHPNWGHYAIATARLIWPDPNSAAGDTRLMTRFAWDEGAPIPGVEDFDVLGRPRKWSRQEWLRGSYNLFEPGWSAALVPLRTATDIRDWPPTGEDDDSNTALLMRSLRRGYWRKNILDSGYGWHNTDTSNNAGGQGPVAGWDNMRAPPMQGANRGKRLDWGAKEIEGPVSH